MGEAKGERYLNRQRLARDNLLTKKSKKQVDDTRHTNMSMVVNGKLENTVSNICVGPNCFDILDDILLFSIFRDTLVLQHKGYNYGASEQIEVKVHVRVGVIEIRMAMVDISSRTLDSHLYHTSQQ